VKVAYGRLFFETLTAQSFPIPSSSKCGYKNPHPSDDSRGSRRYAKSMTQDAIQQRKGKNKYARIVQVLICDDEPRIREALKTLLSTFASSKLDSAISRIKVVGDAADGQEAIQRVAEYKPDIVLMDGCMPLVDGL
jgi:PleD family two-component response regulator